MAKGKQKEQTYDTAGDINGFTVANKDKFERAVNGTIGPQGALVGGVGEDATPEAKLAEYDRLGGLILKGKYKVKTGSFYDFDKKTAFAKPKPVLVLHDLEGNTIDHPLDEEIPIEVLAAEKIADKKVVKADEAARKKAAIKAKAAKKDVVEDDGSEADEDSDEDEE